MSQKVQVAGGEAERTDLRYMDFEIGETCIITGMILADGRCDAPASLADAPAVRGAGELVFLGRGQATQHPELYRLRRLRPGEVVTITRG
jgi:hypothetical protein